MCPVSKKGENIDFLTVLIYATCSCTTSSHRDALLAKMRVTRDIRTDERPLERT